MNVLGGGRRTVDELGRCDQRGDDICEDTVKYLLLLANAPDAWDDTETGDPTDGVITDWVAYTRALSEAGVLVGGAALHGNEATTTVRVRRGARLLTDGPFADTNEHLIGYYVIDVPHLDIALDWAAKVPNARTGSIEVRPLQPDSEPETIMATGRTPGTA